MSNPSIEMIGYESCKCVSEPAHSHLIQWCSQTWLHEYSNIENADLVVPKGLLSWGSATNKPNRIGVTPYGEYIRAMLIKTKCSLIATIHCLYISIITSTSN